MAPAFLKASSVEKIKPALCAKAMRVWVRERGPLQRSEEHSVHKACCTAFVLWFNSLAAFEPQRIACCCRHLLEDTAGAARHTPCHFTLGHPLKSIHAHTCTCTWPQKLQGNCLL